VEDREEELIQWAKEHDPALHSKLVALKRDGVAFDVRADFRLEKFDGEKRPGDGKEPVEVIEGGDGRPTVMTFPKEE